VWPNNFVGYSYEAEVNYLKNWITDRLAFMDENLLLEEQPSGIVDKSYGNHQGNAIGIYNTAGIKQGRPRKGVNIVRYDDGSTRKVLGR
jgi:hypothetical protein